ncbi:ubiquitin-like modifier-activating enzyme 7 isoform X6 [Pogoniulus pusillus]|uniref:ubiquitin-like modifier-activating enzyme 7 isoform X6 n=1 Tax=Pogoniulus pusillus TaxID=488313 RepID=UPI0030B9380B
MAGSGEQGLYSRQLYVLGGGARRLAEAAVLVSGLRGTGAQVAAALVLAGTGRVVLHDSGAVRTGDLSHQFLLGGNDVGQNRAEVSQRALAELNPHVVVAAHTEELSEAFLASFQVVVLTESPLEEQLWIGDFCHVRGICFIVADTKGLAGQLFCDFGEHFVVEDPAEGDPVCAIIQHISQGNPGVVTCIGTEDSHGHLFCDGDLVTFSGVEGMSELNGQKPIPVHVLDAFRLEIGDTSSFSPYCCGGLVLQERLPQVHSYKSLRQALAEPRIQVASPDVLLRSQSLHAAFQALHIFCKEQGHLPRPRARADAERMLELARSLRTQQGLLDEYVVRAFASVSAGDLCPMAAVVGAMAAQEALKAITGKFLPLDQWLYFDALECLELEEAMQLTEEDCAPRGTRYDGQIAVFGATFQEQLGHQKYLVVGAGAIGCELLKNFAMMGLAAGPGGHLTVTDMDTIALSNLHRQLLYRSSDISKPKSVVAAAAIQRMNPDVSVTAHQNEVGPATESLYGDDFFQHLNGVTSALDSMEARTYLENRCVRCLTPLLDSGTEGPRGNVLAMVPFLTKPLEPAGASRDGTFPFCTLRYFPRTIQHTLQETSPGIPFWTGDRSCPHPLTFDPDNNTHLQYILATAHLFAKAHKVPPCSDQAATQTILRSTVLPPFLPQEELNIPLAEEQEEVQAPEDHGRLVKLTQDLVQKREELLGGEEVQVPLMEPIHFEKDNDIHVDFITAASNLRAENYGIPPADWLMSKRIAGRIVPAIITTTAAVAGLVCLEVYKLVWGCQDLKCYRNSNLCLSDCLLLRIQPLPPTTYWYGGKEWSCWDHLELQAVGADGKEMTVQEVLDWLQRTYGWSVTMLLHGYTVIYDKEEDEEIQAQQQAQRLSEKLEHAREMRRLELLYVCEGEDAEASNRRPPLLCSLP